MSRTEVTTDKHGRISLELVIGGHEWALRYLAEEKPDGTIVLTRSVLLRMARGGAPGGQRPR
jgi:hypothetical protein